MKTGIFFSHINTDQHTFIEHIKYGKWKLNHTCLTCKKKPH